jgi:hypothetical protein
MFPRAGAGAWALAFFLFVFFLDTSIASADAPRVIYRSPSPGARYLRPETNLIFRFDRTLDRASLPQFTVVGSASGSHSGQTTLASDGRTLLFRPDQPFFWGERVDVGLASSVDAIHESLSFTTGKGAVTRMAPTELPEADPLETRPPIGPATLQPMGAATLQPMAADSLPASFPQISSTIYETPAPGMLFTAPFSSSTSVTPYLLITDNAGTPLFYKALNGWGLDFKMQPNGLLTYYDASVDKFFEMDSTYAIVDSFACGNGYLTDEHELRLLPNGHALLMSYDGETVDMSDLVSGGDPTADVVGCIIQELDENKNVVFQWRSWDHFDIFDATHENMQATYIDYVHGNALEIDDDGNILLSSRDMDEITKIDRQTGDIIWRWGGKNNEFNFLGDTLQFSHQHAIRRLDNGHYVLFDNGNYHSPPFSRAVEYVLDQNAKTATNVWQYRNTPDSYAFAMGYVDRLPNGNTLICWGAAGPPNLIEVDPNGQKVMQFAFPANVWTYRAFRLDWVPATTSVIASGNHTFQLSANAPNPFRSTTAMTIRLSHPSAVRVRVFDTRGRELRDVAPQISQAAGTYRVQLDLRGHASGVYLCQVSTSDGTLSQRMVHIQ